MKILLTSFWRLPDVGGVWTYTEMLRRGLEKLGHQVDILTRHPERPGYYLVGTDHFLPKEPLFSVTHSALSTYYSQYVSWPERDAPFDRNGMTLLHMETERYCFEWAAAFFGLEQYELIHAQEIISARALSRMKNRDTPLVITMHGLLTPELMQSGGFARDSYSWRYSAAQEQAGLLGCDRIITPTRWLQNLCLAHFQVPKERIRVVPNGMDLERFRKSMQQRSTLTAPIGKHLILCPARLDKVKGQQILLSALSRLKHTRTDWQCWVVGDGYMKTDLQKQGEDLALQDHVLFTGMRDDIPALMRQADIIVLPSLQDNHPFAVMEAQAAGKTTISTTAGGIPEMIQHEQTGLLAAAGDVEALSQNIKRALENAELRRRLEEQSARYADVQWPSEAMVKRTLTVYQEAFQDGGEGFE